MASQTPLVPSKNALRALRRLALFSPTVIAGTLGSICGIATLTVNYHIYRRVQLAERIVETKRILRSVSSGTAAAQLRDMFEAAERNEDFTLQARNAKRRKKKSSRSFSTAAVPVASDPDFDTCPNETQSFQQIERTQRYGSHPRSKPLRNENSYTPNWKGEHVHSLSFEKLAVTSPQKQITRNRRAHPLKTNIPPGLQNDRPADSNRWGSKSIPDPAHKWLQPASSAGDGQTPDGSWSCSYEPGQVGLRGDDRPGLDEMQSGAKLDNDPGRNFLVRDQGKYQSSPSSLPEACFRPPPRIDHARTSRQEYFDLQNLSPPQGLSESRSWTHATRVSPKRQGTLPKKQKVSSNRPRSQLVEQTSHDLSSFIQRSTKQNFDSAASDTPLSPGSAVCDDNEILIQEFLTLLNHAEGAAPDTVLIETLLSSLQRHVMGQVIGIVDWNRLVTIQKFIRPGNRNIDESSMFRRALAVMRYYTQRCTPPDWAAAKVAFLIHRHLLDVPGLITRPVFDLVRHLLEMDPESSSVEEILFPLRPTHANEEDSSVDIFDMSSKYLALFCDENQSSSACVQEMEKIFGVARRRGLELSETLVLPVLQAMVRSRDIDGADILFDQLEPVYGIKKTIRLWSKYAIWLAREENWEMVHAILRQVHDAGIPRVMLKQYEAMFHHILEEFISQNSATRSFGFAVNAIKHFGMVPTGLISRTIIVTCMKERRYDLATEWTYLMSEAFPRMGLGFETRQGMWLLAHTLRDIGASCEEIADAFQLIVHGSCEQPFLHPLRQLVSDLVEEDLRHRLCAASARTSAGELSAKEIPLMTINELIEEAKRFCLLSATPGVGASALTSARDDIAVQLGAIEKLRKIFRGGLSFGNFFSRGDERKTASSTTRRISESARKWNETLEARASFPEAVTQDKLPEYEKLTWAVENYYAHREKQGLPVSHSVLRYLLATVSAEESPSALMLVEAIHASGFVQGPKGVPFDNDLFLKWFHVVAVNGSVKAAAKALWAAIDTGRQLQWTSDFTWFLSLVATLRTSSGYFWAQSNEKPLETNTELEYLTRRIWFNRARTRPTAVSGPDSGLLPKWTEWEEDWHGFQDEESET
ncbi:uncharacterized protein Z518_01009 [Rhinocladiella mackenziei CBS 650.93]|uniref:Pentatricopeptide repeat protein n=1 Tax=Rhinocladiella mackenziei CBS 650.93 TaxID=1442369 RepID=A0A0D2HGY1_9EURO|nr:uncharacterized protein Z518_01009 [Rhinocladiella mackenziei CBS 650.93]KIX09928.1 hypothetical protein Z518_01009 [Rhinocladiella mackenziei CBS 650.93]